MSTTPRSAPSGPPASAVAAPTDLLTDNPALSASGPGLDRIPMVVLGGWLGSGKTTLLNRLLRASGGERFAVVVNDVGAVNLDAELVAARDGPTVELTNGCVCCSIGDSLALTLRDLVLSDQLGSAHV